MSKSFWNRIVFYAGIFGIFAGKILYVLITKEAITKIEGNVLLSGAAGIFIIALIDILIQLYIHNKRGFYILFASITIVWILSVFAATIPNYYRPHYKAFIYIGLIPPIFIWGLLLAFRNTDKNQSHNNKQE